MKFLVILSCLLINHFWRKERALDGDAAFGWLRGRVVDRPPGYSTETRACWRAALLIGTPLFALYVLLWLTDNVLLGFVTLGLHVLVLLLAFDRFSMPQLAQEYLSYWKDGNYEGAHRLLQQRLGARIDGSCDNHAALHERFRNLLLTSYFERLFAVVFWYLLLGPGGALAYALVRMYLSGQREEGVGWLLEPGSSDVPGKMLYRLLVVLEWIPARLLAVTVSLAGDFVAAFAQLRSHFVAAGRGFDVVKASALAALGLVSTQLEPSTAEDQALATDVAAYPGWASRQVEELVALMARSQVIWVTLIALLTLYGVD